MPDPDTREVSALAAKIIDTITDHDINVAISALATAIVAMNHHVSTSIVDERKGAAEIAEMIVGAVDARVGRPEIPWAH